MATFSVEDVSAWCAFDDDVTLTLGSNTTTIPAGTPIGSREGETTVTIAESAVTIALQKGLALTPKGHIVPVFTPDDSVKSA